MNVTSKNFMNSIKNEINENYNTSITENGAIGYRTTGKSLLDINFAVASLRSATENEILNKFIKAYHEDNLVAVKWLWFARDVREGLGERRLFRIIFKHLVNTEPEACKYLIKLVPEYGRWDDLIDVLADLNKNKSVNKDLIETIIVLILDTLKDDFGKMRDGKSISLLAKWMPSVNASSCKTKEVSKMIIKLFNEAKYDFLGNDSAFIWTEKVYRQLLSKLRAYMDVTEVKMSNNEWDKINYEGVPSKANLIYNPAFLRHDEERRRAFLSAVEKGEAKINSSVLYPHEIVSKYVIGSGMWSTRLKSEDATLESLWKALPDMVGNNGDTLVVADGSGSMTTSIGGSKTRALDVANALAIYFSEHCSGEFKNKYITFSSQPRFVEFKEGMSLRDKLEYALQFNECDNTNIQAVFELILNTAINNNMSQNDMPKNILILSDMEFDSANQSGWGASRRFEPYNEKLFEIITYKYERVGYKLPRLVFWNLNSRTDTIPVKENDLGVALVSGFSTNICKMVLSGKTDPYECLLETLNSKRYDAVEEAWKKGKGPEREKRSESHKSMPQKKTNYWDTVLDNNCKF